MLLRNIIEGSVSLWSSPVMMVPQKDRSVRSIIVHCALTSEN